RLPPPSSLHNLLRHCQKKRWPRKRKPSIIAANYGRGNDMSSYQGSDIFQFAIRMEENGEKFYNYAASIAKDPKVYGIFTKLASEEVKHRKLFAEMFSKIDTMMPKE